MKYQTFILTASLILIFCGDVPDASATRNVTLDIFRPPGINHLRKDGTNENKRNVHMVSGYEALVYLRNVSNTRQTGTIAATGTDSTVYLRWIAGSTQTAGEYVSFICGDGASATKSNRTGTAVVPQWPEPQRFSIEPLKTEVLRAGVIFHKQLRSDDGVTSSNGAFTPALTIEVNEDRGALVGYVVAVNRCYNPASYSICSGAFNPVGDILCNWDLAFGNARELNAGRAF